ncbi:hypothetical protein ELE36_02325 [Pseudolysobacter antarcticus]|uniref:Uncharacterized protein n=1 Tax=Pseudolysobacter antarcticus TaxID=2511995 RepID=A0A411HFN2_9GAMM|nr:MltR family transcriptional regulator [Pseudolysobacter antarcticus]QBB69303.1 hypothetical protein ELE36_02325 [Pseudolysobacter antarcticus]
MLYDYNDFQKNYEGESDRSVVILAASFLEQTLEGYIRTKLVEAAPVSKLFEGYAPLSTFAAKIDIAFALGLIPVHIHDDLRTIKKLRNLFAHKPDSLSFSSSQVADICRNLRDIKRSDGTTWEIAEARSRYLNAVLFSLMHMDAQAARTDRLKVPVFHFEVVEDSKAGA